MTDSQAAHNQTAVHAGRKRVVIVGGGFGGLYAAKELANRPVLITIIDRTNHHLFQPLLYQVATAGLSAGDIAQPIRHILKDAWNLDVILGDVGECQLDQKTVVLKNGQRVEYDFLIVAAGARHSYFGHEEWEGLAPGLKTLEDALELRRRILRAFENAEAAPSDEERKHALTFVVIGAGPTGVEMAGAIAELARRTLADDFRHIDPRHTRVILADAAPRVLPGMHESLSPSAQRQLEQLGVEVRVGHAVKDVAPDGVQIEDEFIAARTIVWAAGNEAAPIAKSLGGPVDRAGRVEVNEDLTVGNRKEVFAIGDMVSFKHQTGQPLPGVCPVAMQMGRQAAKNILRALKGEEYKPFHYQDKGSMATIGRNKAVADLHIVRFGGFFAWCGWLLVHLVFLVGLRNQVQVFMQWIWAYFTFSRGARLIYGTFNPKVPPPTAKASSPAVEAPVK